MPAQRLSFWNYVRTGTIYTWYGTEQPGYPRTNALDPELPFQPWKGTPFGPAAGGSFVDIWVDIGSPQTWNIIAGINVNYSSVNLYLSNVSNFASGVWSTTVTITRNPWNRRYSFAYVLPTPVTAQYFVYRPMPPTNGGALAAQTGGVWGGAFATIPRGTRWDEDMRTIEAHQDYPLLGGGTARLTLGRSLTEIHARRIAVGSGEINAWLSADRDMLDWGNFLWFSNRGNPSEVWVMKRINAPSWTRGQVVEEDDLVLRESIAWQ